MKPNEKARTGWRARVENPDTRRDEWVTLDASLTTEEARRDWAVKRSRAIAKRRLELEGGAPRETGTGLSAAVEVYFEDHADLRPLTIKSYRAAANKLLAWARNEGIESADKLTRAELLSFRGKVIAEPKRTMREGGERGERKATTERRGAHAVNRELRSVRVVLGYLADKDLLPRIREGDLRRATARVRVPVEHVEHLPPMALQKLLEAALRHDADTFDMTREERAIGAVKGKTPRYTPIAPFVALVLLTGMRLGEALDLTWPRVDLDALDDAGEQVGELRVTAASKTHRARTVGLEVSPSLRAMLAALKLRGATGNVCGVTADEAKAAHRRLVGTYGAPKRFTWQALRQTCATFLVNAPGIFGSSVAIYRSARQLGHSVVVAEKHYQGLVRGIPATARTLEEAMQITEQMDDIITAIGERPARRDGLKTAQSRTGT